ncbi:MAG: hypothetical protein HUJ61_03880 [Bacilli bacterium]|nr:hypothetical protein [Bacilli bacterium]
MFFKKKQKKVIIPNTKFILEEFVYFRYRDELVFGWVKDIHRDVYGNITYDVQLGGQCPSIIPNVKEEDLKKKTIFEK